MKMLILFLSLSMSVNSFGALTLTGTKFVDQFDNPIELNEKTELIIFTKDKGSSDIVNKIFTDLKVKNLDQYNALYIADISQMPSFVTKLFAMPKMRKYEYKIALDKDGLPTKELPAEQEKISVIKLNRLTLSETSFFNNEEEFKKVIEGLMNSRPITK